MGFPKSQIDGKTQVYGILGNPVRHSLSPLMHNALFGQHNINACYLPFEIEKGSLKLTLEAIRVLKIKGVNITVPFKEEAAALVDEIPDALDRSIGAINTVTNQDGKLLGFNTDVTGFVTALKTDLNFSAQGKSVLVLGAGGSARSVVFASAREEASEIWIHNRHPERAEKLAEYTRGFFPMRSIQALTDLKTMPKVDLVVNCTSCGLKAEDPCVFDLDILKGKPAIYDLIYSPRQTKLLESAGDRGFPRANGLGMLATQGALSFELWMGKKKGTRDTMQKALKKCL